MDPTITPTSSSIANLIIPPAVILVIALGIFVIGVAMLLCLRKLIKTKCISVTNTELPQWIQYIKRLQCCNECTNSCIQLAEKIDCQTPQLQAVLDRICPSKEQCSTFCNKLTSCVCCNYISDYCKNIQLCPQVDDAPPLRCPECDCPCNCHCQCRIPECNEINCGCFTIKCGGSN